jgi:hypothetical protein
LADTLLIFIAAAIGQPAPRPAPSSGVKVDADP